jgi:ATP-dependent Clp protease protease subunit
MLKNYLIPEEKLLEKRNILLYGSINPDSVKELSQNFLYLASRSLNPITFFINSTGGRVIDTLALHDLMKGLPLEIRTVGFGVVASMAVLLLAAGKKGSRYLFPNTTLHIHLPFGRTEIEGTKLEEIADEELRLSKRTTTLIKEYTKQKLDLEKLPQGGLVITSNEAINYSLADCMVEPADKNFYYLLSGIRKTK